MEERRKAKRIKLKIDVEYDMSEYQKWVEAQARNLSECGICIVSSKELSVGAVLQLKFNLPDSYTPLNVAGKVIWNEFSLSDNFYLSGIEFKNVTEENRRIIKKYISAATFDVR
jgi:c-di-GMP-binding flagellar brake protein YcgR